MAVAIGLALYDQLTPATKPTHVSKCAIPTQYGAAAYRFSSFSRRFPRNSKIVRIKAINHTIGKASRVTLRSVRMISMKNGTFGSSDANPVIMAAIGQIVTKEAPLMSQRNSFIF